MARLIQSGDKYYRIRRGKLVEIPSEWVGQVTHPQTLRKRQSKSLRKNSRHGERSTPLSQ